MLKELAGLHNDEAIHNASKNLGLENFSRSQLLFPLVYAFLIRTILFPLVYTLIVYATTFANVTERSEYQSLIPF